MKHQKSMTMVALSAMLLAACPPQMVLAQPAPNSAVAAVGSIRLAATRGQVEFLNGSGRWERLRGPLTAAVGTAVRTAPGAEAVVTYADGSSVTLGETSAMRFTKLAMSGNGADVRIKMLGQMAASISPAGVSNNVLELDTPVGRATINKAFATARAVRQEVASTLTTLRLETPTGRAVRMAVSQGAATLQAFFNVTGVVTSTDPASGTFTITENGTGRARRVAVGAVTVLAHQNNVTAHASRSPQSIVASLAQHQQVIVYGDAPNVEGPGGDMVAQADGGVLQAAVIFPQGSDYISAEDYLQTPDLIALGTGVAAEAGHTLILEAGSLLPTLSVGALLTGISTEIDPQAFVGGVGYGVGTPGPVLLGIAILTAGGIIVQGNNTGHASNTNTITPTTGTLAVTVLRGTTRGRVLARTPMAAPLTSLGSQILGNPSFRGTSTGASLVVGGDSNANPTAVGLFRLGPRLQMHVGATVSYNDMYANMTEVDCGLDYKLDANHSLGAGVRSDSYNLLDPTGFNTSNSFSTTELRYTIRY